MTAGEMATGSQLRDGLLALGRRSLAQERAAPSDSAELCWQLDRTPRRSLGPSCKPRQVLGTGSWHLSLLGRLAWSSAWLPARAFWAATEPCSEALFQHHVPWLGAGHLQSPWCQPCGLEKQGLLGGSLTSPVDLDSGAGEAAERAGSHGVLRAGQPGERPCRGIRLGRMDLAGSLSPLPPHAQPGLL